MLRVKFHYIFDDPWFIAMRKMIVGPADERVRAWRSGDLGQTYRVVVADDTTRQLTSVTMSRRDKEYLTYDEKMMILDEFYPNRLGHREEGAGSSYLSKFSVWPSENDHELLWYSNQLESHHD